jgi:hypothetical protein
MSTDSDVKNTIETYFSKSGLSDDMWTRCNIESIELVEPRRTQITLTCCKTKYLGKTKYLVGDKYREQINLCCQNNSICYIINTLPSLCTQPGYITISLIGNKLLFLPDTVNPSQPILINDPFYHESHLLMTDHTGNSIHCIYENKDNATFDKRLCAAENT